MSILTPREGWVAVVQPVQCFQACKLLGWYCLPWPPHGGWHLGGFTHMLLRGCIKLHLITRSLQVC